MVNKLKKILILLIMIFAVGCETNLTNTPTKQVEMFLSKYQTLDKEILEKLEDDIAYDITLTADQRDKYLELWKKHYQGLVYTIKDETINGDEAIVKTEVEINDYINVMNSSNEYLTSNPEQFNDEFGEYDISKFNDYKLEEMLKSKERVKYTLELKVKKEDKKWKLLDLSEDDYKKLTGMYEY